MNIHKEGKGILTKLFAVIMMFNAAAFLFFWDDNSSKVLVFCCFTLVIFLFFLNFFRNPNRIFSGFEDGMIVAPADGTIVVLRLWNQGGIGLYNGIHMWEGLYVDDTFLARPGSYNWVEYGQTPPTPTGKKHRFPWVLYARKLRESK